ncbi:unnamed protein product [Rotaria magnacalcarata]|uniref:t-SNARE coiled-coil homology domain-containing protein n=1 Tax=Rotaria magnacalcarata TaxID=392030 RepID=A0A819FI68_9BILA|nr:unnamed protein product [Rotaria magnacalcarata]CAF2158792.1 unnamed protein product [Rotaria magnacalcarata]CAF3763161.1 unnamed protein product [Rotaria magnacalcarata]CAF3867762.1 unnamed protein product [Rotaria magnacalcarata]
MIDGLFPNMYSRYTNDLYLKHRTEQLDSKVAELKEIVVKISDEMTCQNTDLPEYQKMFDHAISQIGQARRHITQLPQRYTWKIYLYLIFFSLFSFFIIFFLVK